MAMTRALAPEALAILRARVVHGKQQAIPGANLMAELQAEAAPSDAFLHLALLNEDDLPRGIAELLRCRRELDLPWEAVARVLSLNGMAPYTAAAWETRCPRTAARALGAPRWFQQAICSHQDPNKGRGVLRLCAANDLARLPEQLVLGRMELTGLPNLRQLPREAWVGDQIVLGDLPLVSEWPGWLQSFSGQLEVHHCPGLRGFPHLPPWASLRLVCQPLPSEPAPPNPLRSLDLDRIVPLERLPRCLEVGSLRLSRCPSLVALPRLLAGHSSWEPNPWGGRRQVLVQHCHNLESLPDAADYPAHVHLDTCAALRSLGAGFRVGGDLWLSRLPRLQRLPFGLRVPGNLILEDLPGLEALGDGLVVGGNLWLKGLPKLSQLPKGLKVLGNLVLLDWERGPVPAPDMEVGGDIHLHPRFRHLDYDK